MLKSFYGSSPPQFFISEIAGFDTSSRSSLLKYGGPCHPDDAIVRQSSANKKKIRRAYFSSSILPRVGQPPNVRSRENLAGFGGGYRRISRFMLEWRGVALSVDPLGSNAVFSFFFLLFSFFVKKSRKQM